MVFSGIGTSAHMQIATLALKLSSGVFFEDQPAMHAVLLAEGYPEFMRGVRDCAG